MQKVKKVEWIKVVTMVTVIISISLISLVAEEAAADGVALGINAEAAYDNCVAVGLETKATAHYSVAIGGDSKADGILSTSIGIGATASGSGSIAIGNGITNSRNNSLLFGFYETNSLFVDQSGVVINGIPSESATRYPLAVNGSIKAEEIIVERFSEQDWADYVFNDSYKLPPLENVAAFVKENKHLPEMPSGKQIEKEGLKVADMVALQLKKIEELTLYAIDLKQENESLKTQLKDSQEKVNDRLQVLENAMLNSPVK